MKCPLFQCHSSYYYDNANLDLSDDEDFDNFLYEKKKKGDLYFLYEKAITKVVIETKQNYHIPSDHEKIEREEIKNCSEMDSEELDDINLFLKKNDCENMFSKKNKDIKQVKLPLTYNKNRICSIRQIDVEMENKTDASITDEKNYKTNRKPDLLVCDDIENELKEEKNKKNGNEIIGNFKDDLCNGLKNYFSGIFKNVTKKKNGDEEKKKNIENFFISNLNSSEDDGLSDNIFSSADINSISLDFGKISPLSSFREKAENEEKQGKVESHSSEDVEEHNLAVFNRKRNNGVDEKEKEKAQEQEQKRKKMECSFENLSDFTSFTDHSINTIVDKYEKEDEEEKRHLTNNPFSSFYMKSASCNLSKKKRYNSNNNHNSNRRKKNKNTYNNNSDQKRKTLNTNSDFHFTKSTKKKKERNHMESQKKCIFARDAHKLVNDKWTEKSNIGNRKKMGVASREKHKIYSHEFNKKIDNPVKDNEIFNQRNHSQNKKLQNLSNDKNNEDFTFVHFQKNVNSNILNKFLL